MNFSFQKDSEELNQFKGIKRDTGRNEKLTRPPRNQQIEDYPDTVDWRESGCVGDVDNQTYCGTSWSFVVVNIF